MSDRSSGEYGAARYSVYFAFVGIRTVSSLFHDVARQGLYKSRRVSRRRPPTWQMIGSSTVKFGEVWQVDGGEAQGSSTRFDEGSIIRSVSQSNRTSGASSYH